MTAAPDYEQMLRGADLRVTRPRLAVLGAVHALPHADTDAIITQVIPVYFLSAPELAQTLAVLVKPETQMAAVAGAIVITERSSVVRRVVQIINFLDVEHPDPNVIEVIMLHSADAAEAARLVNAVIGGQGQP